MVKTLVYQFIVTIDSIGTKKRKEVHPVWESFAQPARGKDWTTGDVALIIGPILDHFVLILNRRGKYGV